MVRISGKVTYTDDRVVDFSAGINALARWEAYAQRNKIDSEQQKSPFTFMLYIAFSALGEEQTGAGVGFEKWRESVADVDLEASDANPTQTVTSDT